MMMHYKTTICIYRNEEKQEEKKDRTKLQVYRFHD